MGEADMVVANDSSSWPIGQTWQIDFLIDWWLLIAASAVDPIFTSIILDKYYSLPMCSVGTAVLSSDWSIDTTAIWRQDILFAWQHSAVLICDDSKLKTRKLPQSKVTQRLIVGLKNNLQKKCEYGFVFCQCWSTGLSAMDYLSYLILLYLI